MFDFHDAPECALNRYTHVITEPHIRSKAIYLAEVHAKVLDVTGLSYDDLARQAFVRDLRQMADDLRIQNYWSTWSYDELSGKLEIVFDFGSEADMILFVLRVG